MSEIKCRVCGATPEQSESIYSEQDGGSQHRHLYQCGDSLRASNARLRELLGEVAKFDMKVFMSDDKAWLKLLGEWNEITFRVQKELEGE